MLLTQANVPVNVDIITALRIIQTQQKLSTIIRDILFRWLKINVDFNSNMAF